MPCGMEAGNEKDGRETCPRARQRLHPAPAVGGKCLCVPTPKSRIFKVLRFFLFVFCFLKKHALGSSTKWGQLRIFFSDAKALLCWCRSTFLGINAASKSHFHSCHNLVVVFLTAVAATRRGGVSSQLQTATTVLQPRRNSKLVAASWCPPVWVLQEESLCNPLLWPSWGCSNARFAWPCSAASTLTVSKLP